MNIFPSLPYDVLLVDPPWRFTTRSPKGNKRGPENHYPTMTVDELAALPVGSLAADNAGLFLWACWLCAIVCLLSSLIYTRVELEQRSG